MILDWGRREYIPIVMSCEIKLVGNRRRNWVLCFLTWVADVAVINGGYCGGSNGSGGTGVARVGSCEGPKQEEK